MATTLDPIAVSVAEAARLVGVSRAALYPRVMAGEIPSFTHGSRRLVPIDGLRQWVARQATEGAA